jgi:hypothetical protein
MSSDPDVGERGSVLHETDLPRAKHEMQFRDLRPLQEAVRQIQRVTLDAGDVSGRGDGYD